MRKMQYSDFCKRIRWEKNITYLGILLKADFLKVHVKWITLLIHVQLPARDSVQPEFNYVPRNKAGRIFASFFFEGLHKSVEKIWAQLNMDKMRGTLHENLIFLILWLLTSKWVPFVSRLSMFIWVVCLSCYHGCNGH